MDTDQLKEAAGRMGPGVVVQGGFLGDDPRSLEEILQADADAVQSLGLTHEKIAARMEELRNAGMAGLGDFVRVEPRWDVSVDSIRGRLPCPFGDAGLFPKTVTVVKDKKTGMTISYTDLGIHLVRSHGFYQGKGSLYRLDPAELKETLDVS